MHVNRNLELNLASLPTAGMLGPVSLLLREILRGEYA